MSGFSSMRWSRAQKNRLTSQSMNAVEFEAVWIISPRLTPKQKAWGYGGTVDEEEATNSPGPRRMSTPRGGSHSHESGGTPGAEAPHISVQVQDESSSRTLSRPSSPRSSSSASRQGISALSPRHRPPLSVSDTSPARRRAGTPPTSPGRSGPRPRSTTPSSFSGETEEERGATSTSPRKSSPKAGFTPPSLRIPSDDAGKNPLSPLRSKEGIGGLGLTPVSGTNPLAARHMQSSEQLQSSFIQSMKSIIQGRASEVPIPVRSQYVPPDPAGLGPVEWESKEGRKLDTLASPQGAGLYSMDISPRSESYKASTTKDQSAAARSKKKVEARGIPPESPGYATYGPQDVLSPAMMCLPVAVFVVVNMFAACAVVAMVVLHVPLVAICVVSGLWGLVLIANIVLSCFPDFLMRRALRRGRWRTFKQLEERLACGEHAVTAVIHGKILTSTAGTIDSPARTSPEPGPVVMETLLQSSMFMPQTLMKQTLATDFFFQDRDGRRAVVRVREACDSGMLSALVTQREVMSVGTSRKLPGFLDADWIEKENFLLADQPDLREDDLVVSRGLILEGQEVAIMGTLRESVTHPGQLVLEPLLGVHNATPCLMIGGCIPFCFPSWTTGLIIADCPRNIF